MATRYTAVIKEDDGVWIGWIEEIPGVNGQEPTTEELLRTLEVTLREPLVFDRADAIGSAGHGYEELEIAV